MTTDYGFRRGSMRLYQESYGNVPKDVWTLAKENFARELSGLRTSFRTDEFA